jgi:hypothetical protein
MPDQIETRYLRSGGRLHVINLQNRSDGTGETNAVKVDVSTLKTPHGQPARYCAIDRIEYDVSGMSVRLNWDHNVDDEIATLSGGGALDRSAIGGVADPRSAGGTGDILLTTVGASAGASYDITIYFRPKA